MRSTFIFAKEQLALAGDAVWGNCDKTTRRQQRLNHRAALTSF
jgi:hypothetical protein